MVPADAEYVGYRTEAIVLAGDDPPPLLVRVFPLDVSLSGHVRNADRDPIAGATVRAAESTTTDREGAYLLPISSQSHGMVHATAPGYAAQRRNLEVVPKTDRK